MKKEDSLTYNKILIINLGGIGDILLSFPALRALRNLYPASKISILVSSKAYEIVESLPYVDDIFTFDIEFGGIIPFNRILRNLNILFTLRKINFDLAINMRTMVSRLSAKKVKLMPPLRHVPQGMSKY